MELRGIGLINVRDLFGVTATRTSKRVELVVQLERWDPAREYERLGLDETFEDILGVPIASVCMPVAPGRNLAILVEVAVRNHLLRTRGEHAARRLAARLDHALRARSGVGRGSGGSGMSTRRTPKKTRGRRRRGDGAAGGPRRRERRPRAGARSERRQPPTHRFIVLTGLSGAGKSQAMRALEDLGYFCVDNLPITLLPTFAELTLRPDTEIEKAAVVIDVREGTLLEQFPRVFETLRAMPGLQPDADLPRGQRGGAGPPLQRDAAAASAGPASIGARGRARGAGAARRRSGGSPTRSSTRPT